MNSKLSMCCFLRNDSDVTSYKLISVVQLSVEEVSVCVEKELSELPGRGSWA